MHMSPDPEGFVSIRDYNGAVILLRIAEIAALGLATNAVHDEGWCQLRDGRRITLGPGSAARLAEALAADPPRRLAAP